MTEAIFKCQCGEQKKVSGEYIGKKVKCPKCKTIVEVQKFTPDENISKEPSAIAQCSCGYSKQLPSKYINKTANCPKCGKSIKIEELIDLKNLQETPISNRVCNNNFELPEIIPNALSQEKPDSWDKGINFFIAGAGLYFILGPEIFIIAVVLGLMSSSSIVFAISLLVLIFCCYKKSFRRLFCILLGAGWGFIGGVIGSYESIIASIVLGLLAFLLGWGIHEVITSAMHGKLRYSNILR